MIQQHFDYSPLWGTLSKRGISQGQLQREAKLSPSTLAKIGRNEAVAMDTIARICLVLKTEIGDVVQIAQFDRESSASGTFAQNNVHAVHRWFPYLEGYSKEFVETELAKNDGKPVVYDPFGGSGTTPLVASQRGLRSYYSEINPAMRFIAKIKTEIAPKVAKNETLINSFVNERSAAIRQLKSEANYLTRVDFGGFEKYFSSRNLAQIVTFKKFLENANCEPEVHDLLRFSMATIAVPSSKMVRRGDLRYKTAKEQLKPQPSFLDLLQHKFTEVEDDLRSMSSQQEFGAKLAGTDAASAVPDEPIDLIVTSPPYLNGTNYFRNTKLELKLLELVEEDREIGKLFRTGVTAGINNVSKYRDLPQIDNQNVMKLCDLLEDSAYDSRIPKMVAGYFSDMKKIAIQIRDILNHHGRVSLDIGDSQFGGIHVPTHTLLTDLFEDLGFRSRETTVLRTRRSRNGMLLSQRVLRFEKAD